MRIKYIDQDEKHKTEGMGKRRKIEEICPEEGRNENKISLL